MKIMAEAGRVISNQKLKDNADKSRNRSGK